MQMPTKATMDDVLGAIKAEVARLDAYIACPNSLPQYDPVQTMARIQALNSLLPPDAGNGRERGRVFVVVSDHPSLKA